MTKIGLVLFFVFVSFTPAVFGIGIGTNIKEIPFEAGEIREVTYYIVMQPGEEGAFSLFVEGPYAEWITIVDEIGYVGPSDGQNIVPFTVLITFPDELPDSFEQNHIILETQTQGSMIGSRVQRRVLLPFVVPIVEQEESVGITGAIVRTLTTPLSSSPIIGAAVTHIPEVPSLVSFIVALFVVGTLLGGVFYYQKQQPSFSVELLVYIHRQLHAGRQQKEIMESLVLAGWSDKEVKSHTSYLAANYPSYNALHTYLAQSLGANMTHEEIQNALAQKQWPKELVIEYLKHMEEKQ